MTVAAASEDRLEVSRQEIEDLAAELGHVFYLVDLDRIKEHHDDLLAAFRGRYPKTVLAYSVKTHYTPRVLALIRELGSMAEVVSEMEYDIASRVGFASGEIMVNGPLHEDAFLEKILLQGVRINLDGGYMLDTLHRLSRAHPGRRFRVGLRLNYAIPGADWSRFGFATDARALRRLAGWFEAHENCELVGLHSHFPLAPHDAGTFRARLEGLVRAAREGFPGVRLEYLDLGGGFRRHPADPPVGGAPEAVAAILRESFAAAERPTLYVEPGTAVVASAVAFVCRVYDVKRVGGRTLALTNGSNHHINTMMWHTGFDVRTVRTGGDEPAAEVFDVVGNTCMERKDLICSGVAGPVARGDYLVFHGVGAYSSALKPPFIHPCPAIVARRGGRYEVVKRRETVDDVLRTFEL